MSDETQLPSDELLTAFIDGELPAADVARIEALLRADKGVAARLEFLSRSNLPFKEAFEPMLAAAPRAELEDMLGVVPVAAKPTSARASRRGFLGALAACLVAGVVADRAFIGLNGTLATKDESGEWRAVVAEYIALYTPDTLADPVVSGEVHAQLARVDEKLGLSLSPEVVSLPGIDFKRAQLLQYDDKPLAQIAYLDPQTGPIALCIVRSDAGVKEPDIEGRKGMNVVYWSNGTHAFMLIGHAPVDQMRDLASHVRTKLSV
ncbi:hypothetical protein [Rhizobium sp. Root1220]|uniref:anti-sigma factor family protein n=1 Tax=Rhizobium sp. Root1220 TaxID=1736432 RepID=UPI0007010B26|nr:hypothetical protein [Rhizobium sp. Root1220]KQV68296.1 Fis family transcriptional regulator [Rhizobium sp. Root1220]